MEYWGNNGSDPDWSRYFEVYYSNPDILFNYINTLTKAEIADGVTSIGDCAFEYCTGLTSVTFEDGENWYKGEEPVSDDVLVDALITGEVLTKNTN